MANIIQRLLSPFRFFRRGITYNIGPAKDWPAFRALFQNSNQSRTPVTPTTVNGIPAYARATTILSEQIAALPLSVYRIDKEGNITEAKSHPLWRLLNFRPHQNYDTFIWREAIMRRLIAGAAATLTGASSHGGNCINIINRDARGAISSLELVTASWEMFLMNDKYFYKIDGKSKVFAADDILHFRFNTTDGLFGQSNLDTHRETLGRAISEIKFSSSYYGNGAHLSAVLETDKPLNADQSKVILDSFLSKYGGPDNMGSVGVLAHGLKFKHIGRALDVADIDARRLTTADISNITGVPEDMLSSTGGKTSTYASAEQRNKQFVTYTLRGWCKRLEAELNSKLFAPANMGKIFVRFNLDGLLRADTKTRGAFYQTMYNIRALNPNEIRAMENRNPYEGGDEYGLPFASNAKEGINKEKQEV